MAWQENTIGGKSTAPIREYICDTVADIADLPKNAPMGSNVFVIETSEVRMKKSDGTWKAL